MARRWEREAEQKRVNAAKAARRRKKAEKRVKRDQA
jgi:hypothetical protein